MATWPDITQVPTWGNLPVEIYQLPRVLDRLRAALYFGQESSTHPKLPSDETSWRKDGAGWLMWAAIVAISSAREGVELDMADNGKPNIWKSSAEFSAIKSDPLLSVIHELRNYAVHFELPSSKARPFKAIVGDRGEFDFGDSPYFEPLRWSNFSLLRNVSRANHPSVTQDTVAWFNKQASDWPAIHILSVARHRFADHVANFVRHELR